MSTRVYKPDKRHSTRRLESISGTCLERMGLVIPHGAFAIVDCSLEPRMGDLVHCDNEFGTIHGFIKQVQNIEGDTIIVGTAYENPSKDFTFKAGVIYGVVTEVFCKLWGKQVYFRPEVSTYDETENPSEQM